MSEFRGEMKTLVQTYVELLYPDDLEMQDALFENITTGKASVTVDEMRDYVATRSSWYAEIEAVNPAMAVVHNQNDEFVGTVEVMDMDDDPDGVEVFINDEQMNEISSINLYEDDRFWEDYDAETFNAESLKGRWNEGATRVVHGVSVTKTPMAERYANEKPDYRLSYKGFNARISYSGVAFYLPCWEYKSYGLKVRGKHHRSGCFENPMEALLGFKRSVDSIDPKLSQSKWSPHINAETFNAMSFKQWSQDEMNEELHGGQDMDFDSWLNDEIHTHGNIPLREWGYEEEHDEPEHQHAEFGLFTPHPSPPEPKDKLTGEDGYYTLPQIKRMIARDMIYHSSDGDVDFNDIFDDAEIEILTSWADEAGEDVREYIEDRFLTYSELVTAVTNASSLKSMQRIFEAYKFPYRVTADRKLSDGSYEYKLELIPKFKKAQAESMVSKQGKVRTLSGKPHKARKMMKDKNISPEEAKTRLSFRARKGIDTYAEPFEEIGNFYSGKKGILKIVGLGALVGAGVWITKNKLLE